MRSEICFFAGRIETRKPEVRNTVDSSLVATGARSPELSKAVFRTLCRTSLRRILLSVALDTFTTRIPCQILTSPRTLFSPPTPATLRCLPCLFIPEWPIRWAQTPVQPLQPPLRIRSQFRIASHIHLSRPPVQPRRRQVSRFLQEAQPSFRRATSPLDPC